MFFSRSQISKIGILCIPLLISCSVYPPMGNATDKIKPYSYLTVEKSNEVNKFGNPIFKVSIYENGVNKGNFKTVIGRSDTQNLNRSIPGNQSPLPNGQYSIDRNWVYSPTYEIGEKFWPIYPLFNTRRSDFGFHLDPSFEKDKKEDGTAGCIGMLSVEDRDKLFDFIARTQPRYLEVNIK